VSKTAVALVLGLLAFLAGVLAIAFWAAFSGDAGEQRGLIIRNTLDEDVVVRLDDGQEATLGEGRREHTFVVTRDDFPSYINVAARDGAPVFTQQYAYTELADAEFRLSIDERGIYPTTIVR
jgi:hypothetical protein